MEFMELFVILMVIAFTLLPSSPLALLNFIDIVLAPGLASRSSLLDLPPLGIYNRSSFGVGNRGFSAL